jgi:hypothetical protein
MFMKGVPKGYKENWAYHGRCSERKVGPSTWKGTLVSTKYRHTKAMGPRPGSRFAWDWKGRQTVVKTGKGRYETRLNYTKRLVRAKVR